MRLLTLVCAALAGAQPSVRAAQESMVHALAASSDARAAASEVSARFANTAAESAHHDARDQQNAAERAAPKSAEAVAEEAQQLEHAQTSMQQANAAVATGDVELHKVGPEQTAFGSAEAHKRLGDVFKAFEDWKFAALHSPEREARKAIHAAAKPYVDAMIKTEKKIDNMSQRAQGMADTAKMLRGAAVAVANGAVTKQAQQRFDDAANDMTNAHHMLSQAEDYTKQSGALGMQAQVLNLNIPGYQNAAAMAGAFMGNRYNPDGRPPPPVPLGGFTLAPPPVFLQQQPVF